MPAPARWPLVAVAVKLALRSVPVTRATISCSPDSCPTRTAVEARPDESVVVTAGSSTAPAGSPHEAELD